MPFSLLIRLSWRNLWRHSRRNAILLAGIAVAVAGVVLLNSLLRGMQSEMQNMIIDSLNGHVKVLQPGYLDDPSVTRGFELAPDWDAALQPPQVEPAKALDATFPGSTFLLQPLRTAKAWVEGVLASFDERGPPIAGWAKRVRVPAVVMSERETRGVQLVGIDPAQEDISFLGRVSFAGPEGGEGLTGPDDRRIVIGADLAAQLATTVGRRLVLVTQGADGRSRETGARIAGIFKAESAALEKTFVFTGAGALQAMLDTLAVTEVSVRLSDDAFEASVIDALAGTFAGLDVMSWKQLEPQAANMVAFADSAIYIYFLVIMGALVFGLVNTLVTAVMERVRELGMLRALGMRPRSVVAQVVVESSLIMCVGVAAGLLIAYGSFQLIADGIDLSAFDDSLATFGMRAIFVPVLRGGDVVLVAAMSLGLGLVASFYPARRAVKLKPLDALRR